MSRVKALFNERMLATKVCDVKNEIDATSNPEDEAKLLEKVV